MSYPNLDELDCSKYSSTFSSVFNQLLANAIAQHAILPQAISIWGSKSSLHRDTQISAKKRIRMLTISSSSGCSSSGSGTSIMNRIM